MAKVKRQLFGLISVFSGNASVSDSLPVRIPMTRPLTLTETKMLWDVERSLNALPLPAGTRVVIDVNLK